MPDGHRLGVLQQPVHVLDELGVTARVRVLVHAYQITCIRYVKKGGGIYLHPELQQGVVSASAQGEVESTHKVDLVGRRELEDICAAPRRLWHLHEARIARKEDQVLQSKA